MKNLFLTIVFASCCILFLNSCEKNSNNDAINEKSISACGVTDAAKNLPWLAELIEKAKTDETGNYRGGIWLEKFKDQDIFVTNMILGSGGVAYWFFDCSGNHFISKNWEYESCPACKFVGNHHVFMKDEEEFHSFMLNMKLNVVVYTPY